LSAGNTTKDLGVVPASQAARPAGRCSSVVAEDRSPIGFLISALGAAVLGISVFLPWYGVSITAAGAASAQQMLASVAQQYGNGTLQEMASQVGAGFSSVAGRQITTLSAHDVLKYISAVLLLLAAIALVGSLLRLADLSGLVEVGGGQIALVGVAAALCVLFRMAARPGSETNLVSLSLSWGIWLALVGATAIIVGGLWSASAQGHSSAAPDYDQIAAGISDPRRYAASPPSTPD
jgi:hypothetical protein